MYTLIILFLGGKKMLDYHISLQETLLPALVQCFGIMLLGYILGRFQILGQKEAGGISKFVQYLALPALIFESISTMSFSEVKWEFIASIFVSKAFIFICVVSMTILLTHPVDLGKSGIYAIAATQSNDFALAYPMILSLYKNSHPDYPSYLYMVAPIQLLILNTIGFFIIEMHNQKFDNTSKCHAWKIWKRTLKNPIVFMIIIGLLWNISFGNKVLPIFDNLIKTLSAAFPATALLLVGHTMACKNKKSENHISITVALLIITKNLLLPILIQKVSAFMLQNSSDDEIQSFSNFGFLYGTIPTAPSAYVFASQFDISVDVITKTIIGSTLLSAPLMFASASVISLSQLGFKNITFYLTVTIQYLSCAGLLCCTWLLISFIIGKKFKNISFGVTIYIFLAQFLTSIGGLLLFFPVTEHSINFYAQYILSIGGMYATRACTLFLAALLLIIRCRSLCYILQRRKCINSISVLCLIIPFAIASLTLLSKKMRNDGSNCQLGVIQNIVTFVVTFICFMGTILCLILQHICFRSRSRKISQSFESTYQTCEENIPSIQVSTDSKLSTHSITCDTEAMIDVEDLGKNITESQSLISSNVENLLCDSHYSCSTEQRLVCTHKVTTYQKECGLYDDTEIFQHTILLISMTVAMTVSLTVCFWKLIMEKTDGIYIELEFLDTVINYSLGILLFVVFGFSEGLIYTIKNKWKAIPYCSRKCETEISVTDICYDFMTKYERGFQSYVHNYAGSDKYCDLFSRSDLIQWLLENVIVKSYREAERYISSLEEGHVIEVVDKCQLFPENELVFRLTNSDS